MGGRDGGSGWRPRDEVPLFLCPSSCCASRCSAWGAAQPAPRRPKTGGPDLQAIDAYVEQERTGDNRPSLALAIVRGDRIEHVPGFGRTDRTGGLWAATPRACWPREQVLHRDSHHAAGGGRQGRARRPHTSVRPLVPRGRHGCLRWHHHPAPAAPHQRHPAAGGPFRWRRSDAGRPRARRDGRGPRRSGWEAVRALQRELSGDRLGNPGGLGETLLGLRGGTGLRTTGHCRQLRVASRCIGTCSGYRWWEVCPTRGRLPSAS